MKDSTKDLVRQLHKDSNTTLKKRIEVEFPFLLQEANLIEGSYYRKKGTKLVLCFNGDYNSKQWGFNLSGDWSPSLAVYNRNNYYEKLEDNEVKDLLVKEAIKRGFIEGTTYICAAKCTTDKERVVSNSGRWEFFPQENRLSMFCNNYFFEDGAWAIIREKVEDIRELTVSEISKELGYKVKVID